MGSEKSSQRSEQQRGYLRGHSLRFWRTVGHSLSPPLPCPCTPTGLLQAQLRHVSSSTLGYLGGISWATIAAHTVLWHRRGHPVPDALAAGVALTTASDASASETPVPLAATAPSTSSPSISAKSTPSPLTPPQPAAPSTAPTVPAMPAPDAASELTELVADAFGLLATWPWPRPLDLVAFAAEDAAGTTAQPPAVRIETCATNRVGEAGSV